VILYFDSSERFTGHTDTILFLRLPVFPGRRRPGLVDPSDADHESLRIISFPMKAVLSFTCAALAALAVLAGCHREELAVRDHPRSFPGVASRDVTFYSSALGRTMPYRVYIPKDITVGTRLPVVYLLHGCGSSFRDWSNYSNVGAYAAKGLILVMVDGACSYYMNAALNAKDRYEDYLVHDVPADTESRFPVLPGRENRAVVGVSMGGFAAVKLALTRPDLFAFVGAISPAIDVPSRHFSLIRWSQSMRFRTIFGSTGSEMRIHSDPFVLINTADPAKTSYIYITAGKQEPLLPPILRFVTLLNHRKYAFEFHTKPGGHDWSEWDSQVPGCLDSLLGHIHQP
jgi:S-formylglutathione hydrolase FrmB